MAQANELQTKTKTARQVCKTIQLTIIRITVSNFECNAMKSLNGVQAFEICYINTIYDIK